MKKVLAILALAGLVAGCNTGPDDMGSTTTDSGTISGAETNLTNGTTLKTNGTLNGTSPQNGTLPQNGTSPQNGGVNGSEGTQSGNEP